MMLTDSVSSTATVEQQRLRVLFALPGLHRVTRGAEVAFEELARQIALRSTFEVTLIGSGAKREREPYRYVRARCIARELFERWPSLPYLRDHYAYEELSFAPNLMRHYSPADFDVTVTCGYPYTNWILRARRTAGRPRHVYVTQNGDWMVHARHWEYRYFSCDGLVCTNPDYFGRHQDRFPSVLIPNGVNPDVFRPGPRRREALGLPAEVPVVLMVSALTSFKRVLEGIRCASQLPNAYLVIAGEGELRREAQELGTALMPGRFLVTTFPRSRMPDVYRSADVFLHMCQDEPSANAYIEALATGLPIVTHDRRVTRWTLEDQALLVDTSEEQAVVMALRRAIDLRTEACVKGRRELAQRRFSWEAIAGQYCDFFRFVVAGANTSRRSAASPLRMLERFGAGELEEKHQPCGETARIEIPR